MFFYINYTEENFTLINQTDKLLFEASKEFLPSIEFFEVTSENKRQKMTEFLNILKNEIERGNKNLVLDSRGRTDVRLFHEDLITDQISFITDAPYGAMISDVVKQHRDSYFTYSDVFFKEFYDDLFEGANYTFVPHAGPNNIISNNSIDERPINYFMPGRVCSVPDFTKLISSLSEGNPAFCKILSNALSCSIEENIDIYISYKNQCFEMGYSPFDFVDMDRFQFVMQALSNYKENKKRIEVIKSFKGKSLYIAGPVDSDIKDLDQDDYKYLGLRFGNDILALMSQSKVVLNPVSVFPGGSHERIWFAMACSCAVASDSSIYLKETLTDNENIFYFDYSKLNDQVEYLDNLCHDQPEKLQEMVDQTKDIYLNNHTSYKVFERYILPLDITQKYV